MSSLPTVLDFLFLEHATCEKPTFVLYEMQHSLEIIYEC